MIIVSISLLWITLRNALLLLGLPSTTTNLRNKKINTKWCVLVGQEALEFCDLFSEHVWCVANATDHANTASIGDCCCELRASSNVHASEHDGVCDLEQVGSNRADLFCWDVSMLFTIVFLKRVAYEEKP